VTRLDAPSPKQMSHAAHRAKRRWWWRRWQFRWHMGCRFRGHALRQRDRAICHLRRQDHGGMEFRSGQPKWLLEGTRIRRGRELDQFGPRVGPQRLRFIRAIRRL
jgi:hypothetical protein